MEETQFDILNSFAYKHHSHKILTGNEKLLLFTISGYSPCFASYLTLSMEAPMSRRECIRRVKSLEEKGIIHVERIPRKKGQQQETNKITINRDKIKELLTNKETQSSKDDKNSSIESATTHYIGDDETIDLPTRHHPNSDETLIDVVTRHHPNSDETIDLSTRHHPNSDETIDLSTFRHHPRSDETLIDVSTRHHRSDETLTDAMTCRHPKVLKNKVLKDKVLKDKVLKKTHTVALPAQPITPPFESSNNFKKDELRPSKMIQYLNLKGLVPPTSKVVDTITEKSITNIPKELSTEFENILALWNEVVKEKGILSKAISLNPNRTRHIKNTSKAYLKDHEAWRIYFYSIYQSKFLLGMTKGAWKASFDWVINPNNVIKVVEGKYNNKENTIMNMQNPYETEIDIIDAEFVRE